MEFQKSSQKTKTNSYSNFGRSTYDKENSIMPDVYYMNSQLMDNLNNEELRNHAILYEYKLLLLYGYDLGIFVIPNFKDNNVWDCVIFIRNGLYGGGKFKFIVTFQKEFPKIRPIVRFLSKIYHPLIDANSGLLDLNTLFPHWKYGVHLIYTIFSEIKNIFTDISHFQNINSLNPEAAEKFVNDLDGFFEIISKNVEDSKENIYENNEESSLNFSEFNSEHEIIKKKLEEISENKDLDFDEKKNKFLNYILGRSDS